MKKLTRYAEKWCLSNDVDGLEKAFEIVSEELLRLKESLGEFHLIIETQDDQIKRLRKEQEKSNGIT